MKQLVSMLIGIARLEKPVRAITTRAAAVDTPPTTACQAFHFGKLRSTINATPYSVTVLPKRELIMAASPTPICRTANAA